MSLLNNGGSLDKRLKKIKVSNFFKLKKNQFLLFQMVVIIIFYLKIK